MFVFRSYDLLQRTGYNFSRKKQCETTKQAEFVP